MNVLRLTLLALIGAFGIAASSAPAAAPPASCNGILVSSLAGQAGIVADLTRLFHEETKAAGFPPGSFDAAGAKVHAGGVGDCLAALGSA
jgi:hypothetical protein